LLLIRSRTASFDIEHRRAAYLPQPKPPKPAAQSRGAGLLLVTTPAGLIAQSVAPSWRGPGETLHMLGRLGGNWPGALPLLRRLRAALDRARDAEDPPAAEA
jgi:hypothetical protein